MDRRIKVLMLVKRFNETYPKHVHKFDMLRAIEEVADVTYWSKDGDIRAILESLPERPDVIFHYDIEWRNAFAPHITGLDKVGILKACYVLDVHYLPAVRKDYFERNAKPDLILSASKYPFLKAFPEMRPRFRWLPFGINPEMIRDYGLPKDTAYSLMGLMEDKYPFRSAVLKAMSREEGFVHYRHPGHRTPYRPGLFVHDTYARAINGSMIAFTCGSVLEIPVAKFFEIPGCRTLMLAESNPDIEELGFKDGDNFVACGRAGILELARRYRADAEARNAITERSYNFVHRYHSNGVRAREFVEIVKDALAGRGG
ncbi:glycosyltransferase [Paenibacillus sp. PAMC21692]|uniref:glycosyltransferase family protein n=1 Tax=Paenibacillus sp. PAMC21692 TaxID=2762320 RepID=UPI00164DB4B0|nr:glycosyltransferase [Paenibacillus sp. PAMC21692]QNK56026.1 glycosyltransferase family 1 protein [Paenibacillus sp. PAMC21692]